MQLFICATPGQETQAVHCGKPLAHMAYRIGPDSTLLRQNLLLQSKGGLLAVSDENAPMVDDPNALCDAVLRECGRRSYLGVLLDFEAPPRPDLREFVHQLSETLSTRRKSLFVPEAYAGSKRIVLLNTAISGGSFTEYLRESASKYSQIALDIQRLQMDFTLPAPSGEGNALSFDAFQALMSQQSPATFFSQELCARYFTYTVGETAHFVLYDNAASLRQKLRIGSSMGFSSAFFQWPEISDLADTLFHGR